MPITRSQRKYDAERFTAERSRRLDFFTQNLASHVTLRLTPLDPARATYRTKAVFEPSTSSFFGPQGEVLAHRKGDDVLHSDDHNGVVLIARFNISNQKLQDESIRVADAIPSKNVKAEFKEFEEEEYEDQEAEIEAEKSASASTPSRTLFEPFAPNTLGNFASSPSIEKAAMLMAFSVFRQEEQVTKKGRRRKARVAAEAMTPASRAAKPAAAAATVLTATSAATPAVSTLGTPAQPVTLVPVPAATVPATVPAVVLAGVSAQPPPPPPPPPSAAGPLTALATVPATAAPTATTVVPMAVTASVLAAPAPHPGLLANPVSALAAAAASTPMRVPLHPILTDADLLSPDGKSKNSSICIPDGPIPSPLRHHPNQITAGTLLDDGRIMSPQMAYLQRAVALQNECLPSGIVLSLSDAMSVIVSHDNAASSTSNSLPKASTAASGNAFLLDLSYCCGSARRPALGHTLWADFVNETSRIESLSAWLRTWNEVNPSRQDFWQLFYRAGDSMVPQVYASNLPGIEEAAGRAFGYLTELFVRSHCRRMRLQDIANFDSHGYEALVRETLKAQCNNKSSAETRACASSLVAANPGLARFTTKSKKSEEDDTARLRAEVKRLREKNPKTPVKESTRDKLNTLRFNLGLCTSCGGRGHLRNVCKAPNHTSQPTKADYEHAGKMNLCPAGI
jgi:hypothetical protein